MRPARVRRFGSACRLSSTGERSIRNHTTKCCIAPQFFCFSWDVRIYFFVFCLVILVLLFFAENSSPGRLPGAAQRVEKASQSFAPAGAKSMQIIFPGGVYVGKNTLRPASVQAVRIWRTARARSRPRPVVEKLQRSFSTASAAPGGCPGLRSVSKKPRRVSRLLLRFSGLLRPRPFCRACAASSF